MLHALLLPCRCCQQGGVLQQRGCWGQWEGAFDLADIVAVDTLAEVATAHAQLCA